MIICSRLGAGWSRTILNTSCIHNTPVEFPVIRDVEHDDSLNVFRLIREKSDIHKYTDIRKYTDIL